MPTRKKPAARKAAAAPRALDTYARKRDFTITSEPSGRESRQAAREKKALSFVVQKHDARRLHYDFRLELDGTLKSWAVARGPSLVAGEKRLAVHVEDHPLAYGTFEGTIPQGQYGAGTVIVWDRGTWEPEGDARKGYEKGHLTFLLKGEKLNGLWHLVRMKTKQGERGDNWLLIKADDAAAREAGAADILEEAPRSVQSGKAIDSVSRDPQARRWTSGKKGAVAGEPAKTAAPSPRRELLAALTAVPEPVREPDTKAPARRAKRTAWPLPKQARKAPIGAFVPPSLATAAERAPQGAEWLHEVKFDGYRLQAFKTARDVILYTRKGLDWTKRFPAVAHAIRDLPAETAILDGEAVVENGAGITDFAALQQALAGETKAEIVFYAFDLLYLDGRRLEAAPLSDRKALLEALLADLPPGAIRYSRHFEEDGATLLRHVCGLGAEGLVSKRRDGPYRSGRHRDWLKAKCADRQEFVIIGYVPSTVMTKAVGSLVLGYHDEGRLCHGGRAGSGYTAANAKALFKELDALRRDKAPVAGRLPAIVTKDVRWVEPVRVAEIEFRGWTGDGLVRQAAFKALRDDKPAGEVVRETSVARTPRAPTTKTAGDVRLTHPDRVLWPATGVTKQALADYYRLAWPWIAPHVADRPLALVRCPQGVGHHCFFQKHAWEGHGAGVVLIHDEAQDEERLVAIQTLEGLLSLVQANVLEIHPWGARSSALDQPDRLIFDLDPGDGVGWEAVVAAAYEVRERLGDDGLESFVKTSGGKGLHVVVPVLPKTDWDRAKAYCRRVAETMARQAPNAFTATMAKRERKGRIFIDYLRNGRGATAVAPYSTRARPEAGVSTPLSWDELDSVQRGDQFTFSTIARRLDGLRSDPWKALDTVKQVLPEGR